jgi:predicted PurR-regulated permease PerM
MEKSQPPASPKWGTMTKLVVTLTLVVILGALLVRFKFILGPVLMAFILAYLLFPLASLMSKKTPISWAVAVNLIYLVFILILLALLTWGGVGLIGQVQNLINAINDYAGQLPSFIDNLSHNSYVIGPFKFDFSTFDWQTIGNQILSYVQPTLGKLGGLVGTIASSAASLLAWTAFVVFVSYFVLLESRGTTPES